MNAVYTAWSHPWSLLAFTWLNPLYTQVTQTLHQPKYLTKQKQANKNIFKNMCICTRSFNPFIMQIMYPDTNINAAMQ